MVFYVELGLEAERHLKLHAKRLGRSIDSLVNEAVEELVIEYESRVGEATDPLEDRHS